MKIFVGFLEPWKIAFKIDWPLEARADFVIYFFERFKGKKLLLRFSDLSKYFSKPESMINKIVEIRCKDFFHQIRIFDNQNRILVNVRSIKWQSICFLGMPINEFWIILYLLGIFTPIWQGGGGEYFYPLVIFWLNSFFNVSIFYWWKLTKMGYFNAHLIESS